MKKYRTIADVIDWLNDEISKSTLTASKIATKINVSRSYICRVMNTQNTAASIDIYRRIAEALGFSLDETFTVTKKKKGKRHATKS